MATLGRMFRILLVPVLVAVFGTAVASVQSRAEAETAGATVTLIPAAAPHPVQVTVANPLTLPEMQGLLREAGWPEAVIRQAVVVAGCESGWDPRKTGAAGEFGLFQVHPVHADLFTELGLPGLGPHDPLTNARVALSIWQDEGWSPWSCASLVNCQSSAMDFAT